MNTQHFMTRHRRMIKSKHETYIPLPYAYTITTCYAINRWSHMHGIDNYNCITYHLFSQTFYVTVVTHSILSKKESRDFEQ